MDTKNKKYYKFVLAFVVALIIIFLVLSMSYRKEYDTDQIKLEKSKTIATDLNLDFSSKQEIMHELKDIDFSEEVVDKTQKDVTFDIQHIKSEDIVEVSNTLGGIVVLMIILGVGYLFVKKIGDFTSND